MRDSLALNWIEGGVVLTQKMEGIVGHNGTEKSPPRYSGFDQLPINGKWRHGRGAKALRDINPYNGDVLVQIPHASRDDMDDAYQGAARAQSGWAAALPGERAAVMRRAAQVMEVRREEIVEWLIQEAGSTRIKASMEWGTVHAVLLEGATLPYLVEGRILPADVPGKESRMYRKPVGVVGVISPWNWPMQLSVRSVAPALAVGNAVVLKPASDTPVTGGLLLAKILEEAGLPPSVLSVIVGAGSEIGDAFVTHPVPRVISFTGSTPVGRNIAKLAAEGPTLKRLELELGGNGPFVVLDDADLEQAVEAAVFGNTRRPQPRFRRLSQISGSRKMHSPCCLAVTRGRSGGAERSRNWNFQRCRRESLRNFWYAVPTCVRPNRA